MSAIVDIRKEIARVLEEDSEISDTLQVHVSNSRQLPGKYNNELCVYSGGNAPQKGAALGGPGKDPVYQYIITWLIKFDSKEQLAEAEDVCDNTEHAVYRVLLHENYKNTLWKKVNFPSLSIRPIAPGGTQNSHFGQVLVRMSAYE